MNPYEILEKLQVAERKLNEIDHHDNRVEIAKAHIHLASQEIKIEISTSQRYKISEIEGIRQLEQLNRALDDRMQYVEKDVKELHKTASVCMLIAVVSLIIAIIVGARF